MVTIRCKEILFANIRALLFDKDGTLANSESYLRTLAQRRSRLIDAQIPGVQDPLLMAFGVSNNQLNPSGLMAVGSRLENEIAAAAYIAETGRDWAEALEIARSAFREADRYLPDKAAQTPPIMGTADLLQTLSKAGLKIGILSSDSTANVQAFIQTHHLGAYIHCAYGIDGYTSKSDPRLLQQCFLGLGETLDTTLMLGDSQLDIEMARSAGVAGCIAVSGGWTMPVHVAGADAIVSHLNEIEVIE